MVTKMQADDESTGRLQINVTGENNEPIENATVRIEENEDVVENVGTDISGQTDELILVAPDIGLSLDENNTVRPYSKYRIIIQAEGYETEVVNGAEILPEVLAISNVRLKREQDDNMDEFDIPPHTLYGDYPQKEREPEISPVSESGEIVLSRVVVPETIVVHDGVPSDSTAPNYYVPYRDYIKNVASSEIYATWPIEAIKANVLAIMSFTLNRVYTEFYRNKGYVFTITSSTAYDQKWINGRNIFEPISVVVDEIFNQYLSRPNIKQPILTQYCDGKKVTCPNWLSQWGSCNLARQGYDSLSILRYYFGNSIYINQTEQISGIPSSWPRQNLTIGSSGEKVRQIQEQLFTIATVYPALPQIVADGIYGEQTQATVRSFQRIFNLPISGIIDFATWYKISQIYVGITRIAEPA